MRRRPVLALTLWLLAMAAGAAIVWNSRFVADMSFFLPARPTAEQALLIDQLKEGVVTRLLMVGIEGGNPAQRAAVSRAMRQQLDAGDRFVSVQNGEQDSLDADRDLLFRHRYLLSPAVSTERFSADGLAQAIGNSIDLLASPAGMLLKPFLTRDPTGELFELVSTLASGGSQPNSREGVWASRDGERAMLLLQTRALGSDTDGQAAAIAQVNQAFAEASAAAGVPELRLELSGPGVFAVQARTTIQHEVSRLSAISSIAIALVLIFIYRSPRLLGLGMLPVLSGTLAGIAAVGLVHGTVFGITVGFGSALIGEAVDYAIYYFVQSGRLGLDNWRQRFWPTIRLGVLTSVVGFGALLFSGFPGLAQLGLYALTGVLVAALVTRYLLPHLAGETLPVRDLAGVGEAMRRLFGAVRRLRVPALLLSAAAIAFLWQQRDQLWQANLSVMSTTSAEQGERDGKLRSDLGAPDARYIVIVTGADREAALQAAERSGRILDRLVADGRIGGYESPARFLPSAATQAERRAALPAGDTLRARLPAALAGQPLSAERLEAFIADVEAARQAPLLTREQLTGNNLALAVDSLLLERPAGWHAMLPLRPLTTDGSLHDMPVDEIRQALAGSGALFIDMKQEFDALYGDYLKEAILLSGIGLLAIAVLLGTVLRSPGALGRLLLPLLMAVVIVLAGLHLLGHALHLLHLIGMLLTIAVGSNYALFFHGTTLAALDRSTLASMSIATLTTTIGFGTLALSSVPVLQAIGASVGPGALLAMLLAAMFVPDAERA